MYKLWDIIKPIIISLILLGLIFISSALIWIHISNFVLFDFSKVLQLVLKNMGVYSAVLVGIIVSIFYNSFNSVKAKDKEIEEKIREVGHYELAFSLDLKFNERNLTLPQVKIIYEEKDYEKTPNNDSNRCIVPIKFLTSKDTSSNLKNILAFGDKYFIEKEKMIINNYYQFCMKVKEDNPIYCAAKPTRELVNNDEADIQRYFYLINNKYTNNKEEIIWISAITEEGTLMFINLKFRNESFKEKGVGMTLLQQTNYFSYQGKLCPLYR